MNKPQSINDGSKVCEECKTNFGKEITVHVVEKTWSGGKYLTWANEDGTTHSMPKEQNYIHVWNKEEKEAVKIGGSASLKPLREKLGNVKVKSEVISQEVKVTPKTTGEVTPAVRQMDVADIAEDGLREEIRTHIKVLKIIENEVERTLGKDNGQRNGLFINNIRIMMMDRIGVKDK